MADALTTYLNDHLAGATFGSDLAQQLQQRTDGSPLGETLRSLSTQIDEDRETLIDLMERLSTARNPVKQATAWVAEKASRVKLGGVTASETGLATFTALETLSLGVEGKLALWTALKEVSDWEPLASVDLDNLIERARAQRRVLEHERLTASRQALVPQARPPSATERG
jgi:hypothetical protein